MIIEVNNLKIKTISFKKPLLPYSTNDVKGPEKSNKNIKKIYPTLLGEEKRKEIRTNERKSNLYN